MTRESENHSMFDWTALTRDPVDAGVRKKIKEWLLARRINLPSNDYDAFLIQQVKGKAVLDIGICEHTIERIKSPKWKHRLIRDNSSKCLGVDIIEDLVHELVAQGFNVVCQDATSNIFLGEEFDVVHIGDVIEHVPDPQRLLSFAARHLKPGGTILVRTPNPHHFDYQHRSRKDGISVENMEHISYIVPFHALELARRSGLRLSNYWTMTPGRFSKIGFRRAIAHALGMRLRHAYNELFGEPNTYTTIFVYGFSTLESN